MKVMQADFRVRILETQSPKVLSLQYSASIYRLKMTQRLALFEFLTFVTLVFADNRRATS
jgi:hypothetical protein